MTAWRLGFVLYLIAAAAALAFIYRRTAEISIRPIDTTKKMSNFDQNTPLFDANSGCFSGFQYHFEKLVGSAKPADKKSCLCVVLLNNAGVPFLRNANEPECGFAVEF